MKTIPRSRAGALFAAAALTLALAACGGGGNAGDSVATAPPPPAPDIVLSGVAAEGAPMDGATIQMIDATGAVVGTAIADADGKYTVTLPADAKAPLVASAGKEDLVYHAPVAEAKSGRINITKLTNLIAAQLSPTGEPGALATQIRSGAATVSPAQVREVVDAVVEALQPLLTNAGDTVDPLSGEFDADGTGHDQVLSALDIAINPTGDASNITITVKAETPPDQQPPAITFTSGAKPPPLPQQVATAELPASDTDALVASFLSKAQACYALPVAQRVNGSSAPFVVAPACRELFSGNDPTTFKHNGAVVDVTGAWSGLFRDAATGVTFTSPVIEFLNPGGKLLLGWKNTSTTGSVSWNRVWLQRENGALKAIGNQYDYPFRVRAWSESRNLVNTPDLSYRATGFDVNVQNWQHNGSPLFAKVVVTTPSGRQVTLAPRTGLSFLPVQGTTTSVVRLAGKFMDPATSGVPRKLSRMSNGEGLVWARNPADADTDWTDAEIRSINNIGRWKAEFYLASAPTVVAATQYHETMTRPLTLAELEQRAWATLTPAALQAVIAESASSGSIALNSSEAVELRMETAPHDFWMVPVGAHAPTYVQVFGFLVNSGTPAPRFNDSASISSTARTATINCSTQGSSDLHCASPASPFYSDNARANLLQMFAWDAKDMTWVSMAGTYKLVVSP